MRMPFARCVIYARTYTLRPAVGCTTQRRQETRQPITLLGIPRTFPSRFSSNLSSSARSLAVGH